MSTPPNQSRSGFNHNIRYQNRVFHVQSEDMGPNRPYVLTQIFEGGRVIVSVKVSYSEQLGRPETPQIIQELMKEQHKNMMKGLLRGQYDQKLGANPSEPSAPLSSPQASNPSIDDLLVEHIEGTHGRK